MLWSGPYRSNWLTLLPYPCQKPGQANKVACKYTGFVHCTSSQHVECLLMCCWARCSNDSTMTQQVKQSEDFTKAHVESWLRIFGYAGHCACVGSTCWVLLCKCTRLCWAPYGYSDTKEMLSRVERRVWPVSNLTQQGSTPLNTAQHLSTGCSSAPNMLRASAGDKSSAFLRWLTHRSNCVGY